MFIINSTLNLQRNDLAIITLNDTVIFTKEIRPICLYDGKSDLYNEYATVAGWGSLYEGMYFIYVVCTCIYHMLYMYIFIHVIRIVFSSSYVFCVLYCLTSIFSCFLTFFSLSISLTFKCFQYFSSLFFISYLSFFFYIVQ